MRRYDIVTGILLILSIIDFALAAPVSVQEKGQARVDVGKRWDEELEKLWRNRDDSDLAKQVIDYFKNFNSDTASSVPDHGHGSMNEALSPVQNPASSTANWDLLRMSGSPSSVPIHGSTNSVPPTAPDLASSSDSSSGSSTTEDMQDPWWDQSINKAPGDDTGTLPYKGDDELPAHTSTSSGYTSDSELAQAEKHMYAPQPSYDSWPSSTDSSPDLDFDYDYRMGSADPSTNELGQAHEDQVDHQSLSADSQAEDVQAAARYAAKGKAKVSRHISGTASDVGNAA